MNRAVSDGPLKDRKASLACHLGRADYSMRRYYIDRFHFLQVGDLPKDSVVLDLGGYNEGRRGFFDIAKFDLRVVSCNLADRKGVDVVADGVALPLRDSCCDAVICSEVLEHVASPVPILREAYRVLRPGGVVLVCAPFLFRLHKDPDDYARYTDQYWRESMAACGFGDIMIEKQGLFWSVFADMIRELAWMALRDRWPRSRLAKRAIGRILSFVRTKAVEWDAREGVISHPYLSSYTTGFGIRGRR